VIAEKLRSRLDHDERGQVSRTMVPGAAFGNSATAGPAVQVQSNFVGTPPSQAHLSGSSGPVGGPAAHAAMAPMPVTNTAYGVVRPKPTAPPAALTQHASLTIAKEKRGPDSLMQNPHPEIEPTQAYDLEDLQGHKKTGSD
jgi:hypothetical protein